MTPVQQQRFNTVVGGILIGSGILAWLIALFFSVMPNDEAPAPVSMQPYVNMASCQAALQQLGYSVTAKASDLEVFEPIGEASPHEVRAKFEKASLAWTLCQVPVQAFCAGEGCELPGISMTLRGPIGKPRSAGNAAPSKPAAAKTPPAEAQKK